jgi:hypothetical protein
MKALTEKEPTFAEITHFINESVFFHLVLHSCFAVAGLIFADFVWLVRMPFFRTSKSPARKMWKVDYGTLTSRSTTVFASF